MTATPRRAPQSHWKPRVVLDTNVVLSAILFRQGRLSAMRNAWQAGAFVPVVSRQTLGELTRVLAYPRFRLTAADVSDVLGSYLPYVEAHARKKDEPVLSGTPICRDPKDQMFLELAHSASVDFLVTGDEDLLEMRSVVTNAPFQIIAPGELMTTVIGST